MVMDVVERINELAAEEKCPHCDRSWHERALTQRVARMFESGSLDRNYFAYEDTSPVLCDGSRFIGPLRPEPALLNDLSNGWCLAGFVDDMSGWIAETQTMANEFAKFTVVPSLQWPQYHYTTQKWILGVDQSLPWMTYYDGSWNTLWTNKPLPCEESVGDLPEVDVEFGPQNWHYEFQRPSQKKIIAAHWTWSPNPHLAKQVTDLWAKFKAVPTPAPRGYDFSAFTGELNNTGPKQDSVTKGRNK